MCFQDYYYAGYVVRFVSVYTIFLLSLMLHWYIIIFIFDLFTTFQLPHHNKGLGVEDADTLGYSFPWSH